MAAAFLLSSSLLSSHREQQQQPVHAIFFPVVYAADTAISPSTSRQLKESEKELQEKQRLRTADGESQQLDSADSKKSKGNLNQLLANAGKVGLGGGIPGFIAGIAQVRNACIGNLSSCMMMES